ncbi:uncharacterized protein LOC129409474 [Boleophthalmus pectinirostris]|uniref:uncharacterized protein LOC129409474 n=1 Tax=Boleophthalmus pectinirostris TaxID=150288 RepID=UPI00242ABE1B|nr:uncharacterized protein LOC129409474 [Boleophthalmus pectinirostris]
MTTSVGPMYFFDQPTRQRRKNKGRSINLDLSGEKEQCQRENKDQRDLPKVLPGEAQEEARPEISSSVFSLKEQDVIDAYKRTAPQLLSELAHVLSQHKWSAEGRLPHGLVNILHYTWQELTAGARLLPAPQHPEKHTKPLASSNIDLSPQPLSANQKRDREVATCQVKPQVSSTSARVKKKKSRACKDLSPTSLSFSILNQSSSDQAWKIQQHHISCTEDIHLYKWALERLQGARSSIVPSSEPNWPLLLRHYGDARPKQGDKSERSKAHPGMFLNGLPQIPDMQLPDPRKNQQKLHYRISDGSSIIYYPSGCMAVCQSCSGQPSGGFYSNVFSDSDPPVVIATITAFGHGTVMHPHSSLGPGGWAYT